MKHRTALLIGLGKALVWLGIIGITWMLFIYGYGYVNGTPFASHPHSITIAAAVLAFIGACILALTPDNGPYHN